MKTIRKDLAGPH